MEAKIVNELKEIRSHYRGDKLQSRFSALVTGESGSGKTFLVRTCRLPIHIDSFDPGGTKGLRDLIDSGDVVADTRWESENPLKPTKFAEWKRVTERRLLNGYFNSFGTYVLDSCTTWGQAIMNDVLLSAGQVGQAPRWSHDYVPQKVAMETYIRKLMSVPCDFFLLGHLETQEEVIAVDAKTGVKSKTTQFRLMITGKALITVPLLFDELYVLGTRERSTGLERYILTDAQGKYQARSRLKGTAKLNKEEPADVKAILKKIGFDASDKPKLNLNSTDD